MMKQRWAEGRWVGRYVWPHKAQIRIGSQSRYQGVDRAEVRPRYRGLQRQRRASTSRQSVLWLSPSCSVPRAIFTMKKTEARVKTRMHDGKAGGDTQHYFFGETRSTGVMYATVYRSVRRARRRAAVVYGPITAKQVVISRYHTARFGEVNDGPGPLLQKVEHQWVDNRAGLRTEHMWRRQCTRRGNQSTARHDEMQSGETPTGRLVCGRSGSLQLADIVHQWPI